MPHDSQRDIDALVKASREIDRLTFALSDARMEIATLTATQAELVKALVPFALIDNFSKRDADDTSVFVRVSLLRDARRALAKAKQP